jgi:magnesium transporter
MLINCVAYAKGKRLADLKLADVPAWLERNEGFVWVALRDPEPREIEAARVVFNLPEDALAEIAQSAQRPAVIEYDDDLLLAVIKMAESRSGQLVEGELEVFVAPRFVLSIRTRSPRDFLGVRARCEREPDLLMQGPGYVLYALMEAVADDYFPAIDDLELEFEAIEPLIFQRGNQRETVERLYALKRKVSDLRHAVAPLHDATGKLFGGRVPKTVDGLGYYFRDVHDYLQRVNRALDGLRESIATAIAVNVSLVSIEQTDIGKRLAAWAAIFGAVTALAGIWGMNFEFMPELKQPWGYPAALGLMVATATVLAWRFRRAGWL